MLRKCEECEVHEPKVNHTEQKTRLWIVKLSVFGVIDFRTPC